MTLYRKKPIPVTAVQWHKEGDHAAVVCNHTDREGYKEFAIQSREGWIGVQPGCWIVGPGHEGEFWPVQDSIFRATYEEVPS